MLSFLAGIFLYQLMLIAIVSIFAIAFMEKNKENYRRIGLFAIVFLVYYIMRILPGIIGFQNFELPWETRFFTIFSGVLLFFLFRKHFSDYNYLKLKQDRNNLKITIPVSIATIIGYFVIFYLRPHPQEFNMGLLLFVSTVGPIEEELYFRVLILGLLMGCLDKKVLFIKYPAALLSGIIFGLYHGTFFNFDVLHIITNCVYGGIVGWITVKNKSVLVPAVVHMIVNTIGYLYEMGQLRITGL
jgi:membrane protease YdiL (CAAX protease family)